jgi:hypothetical protein
VIEDREKEPCLLPNVVSKLPRFDAGRLDQFLNGCRFITFVSEQGQGALEHFLSIELFYPSHFLV